MATWHLMFQKPAFETAQLRHVVDVLKAAGNFGGFPLQRATFTRDTADLGYIDLEFKITTAITQAVFADMAKYLMVVAAGLEKAPLPLYFSIMQHSLNELSIDYHIYDSKNVDIYYWQAPPIIAAPEPPQNDLRFR